MSSLWNGSQLIEIPVKGCENFAPKITQNRQRLRERVTFALRSPHEPLDGVRLVFPAEGSENEEGDGGGVHGQARQRLQDQLGPGHRPHL